MPPGPSKIAFAVVKRDQGQMVGIRGKGIEHHPKVVALPDVVVFFVGKPARQFFEIRQNARRHALTKLAVTLDPSRPAPIDQLDLELVLGQRQK